MKITTMRNWLFGLSLVVTVLAGLLGITMYFLFHVFWWG